MFNSDFFMSITSDNRNPNLVLVINDGGGLYHSLEGGETWTLTDRSVHTVECKNAA
jgi:hypothetical protein